MSIKMTALNDNDLFSLDVKGLKNDLSWNGKFFRASKRYVAVIEGVPKESEDPFLHYSKWTPCEILPF